MDFLTDTKTDKIIDNILKKKKLSDWEKDDVKNRVLKKLEGKQVNPTKNMVAYLKRVIRSQIIDMFREKTYSTQKKHSPQKNPNNYSCNIRTQNALDKINGIKRHAFIYRTFLHKSHLEIATLLNIHVKDVKKRVYSGKRRFETLYWRDIFETIQRDLKKNNNRCSEEQSLFDKLPTLVKNPHLFLSNENNNFLEIFFPKEKEFFLHFLRKLLKGNTMKNFQSTFKSKTLLGELKELIDTDFENLQEKTNKISPFDSKTYTAQHSRAISKKLEELTQEGLSNDPDDLHYIYRKVIYLKDNITKETKLNALKRIVENTEASKDEQMNKLCISSLLQIANIKQAEEMYAEAELIYKQCEEIDPTEPLTAYNRSILYGNLKKPEEIFNALKELKELLLLKKDDKLTANYCDLISGQIGEKDGHTKELRFLDNDQRKNLAEEFGLLIDTGSAYYNSLKNALKLIAPLLLVFCLVFIAQNSDILRSTCTENTTIAGTLGTQNLG